MCTEFAFTNFSNPFKVVPTSCVQPLADSTFLNQKSLEGQVLFYSRQRNGKNETTMIDEQAIRQKAGIFNVLIDVYREKYDGVIHLYGVDLKLMKMYFESPQLLQNTLPVQCELMDIGWRYQIESMYFCASQYFNIFNVHEVPQQAETLQKIMRAIRYRVSSKTQAHCLDLILNHDLDSYTRPGAFITNAFCLNSDRGFDHELVVLPSEQNNNEIKLACCAHPRPFITHYTKSPMYCVSCQKMMCIRCQRLRCFSKLSAFVQSTFYIRVYKTKCRTAKRTRNNFEALGAIFPHPDFETLEDSWILFNG